MSGLMQLVKRFHDGWRARLHGRAGWTTVHRAGGPIDPARPQSIADLLEAERERWFLWVPVCFGAGIGTYFALPFEPRPGILVVFLVAGCGLRYAFRLGTWAPVLTGVLLCALSGALTAKVRTEWTRAPVLAAALEARMSAGFIESLEPRRPRGFRITLRLRALQGVAVDNLPERIRFIWNGDTDLRVGEAMTVRVSLKPPPTPVRPDGYDFARRAWFKGIGAVGYAVASPVRSADLPAAPALLGARAWVGSIRAAIGADVERRIPGEGGAIINALIIGQRGKVPETTLDHLRRSGLSHMLAISGLHMAMIAGALFWLLRGGLAAFPVLALNGPIKKGAAAAALAGGIAYLAISGASVATQRATIMIGLMLVAVLLDRPAISQRNVALAALVILAIAPENLLEIGFQMSFAAVVALVAFYERWRLRQGTWSGTRSGVTVGARTSPLWIAARGGRNMIIGTLVTTFVAGVAVAPFEAFHFHRVAQFSLLANLLAMPVFTIVVMPMALMTLISLPFGLEGGSLPIMAWGVAQVTDVAGWVSEKPNAVHHTSAMGGPAFLLMMLGGLWLCLWQKRWRYAGVVPVAFGLLFSANPADPDLLVARDGALVAVRTAQGGLSGSPGRIGAFELTRWLEADGDARGPETVERGDGFACDRQGCTADIRGTMVAMPKSPANLAEDCRRADIVILTFVQARPCPSARLVIDRQAVQRFGVHAVTIGADGAIRLVTVEGRRGVRPWTLAGRDMPGE
ncbi:MAG: ComEC/Rec2 family competence protein [Hyphomicrobiaceae bacterium]